MAAATNYEEINLIGTGAYGTVYKARDRMTNGIVALKKVHVALTDNGIPMNTLREISLLKQLDTYEHRNIVRLLDICYGKRIENILTMFLVFEHVDQDLAVYMEKCIKRGEQLCGARIRQICQDILSGVDFLHSHRIVHRDLKPQNLLVTNSGSIKLADFGLAKTYDFEMRLTSVVVTLWYRSPEVLLGLPYASPVDIWSCGCILAELFGLKPLFNGISEGDQLDKIFQVLGKPPRDKWPENVSITWNSFNPKNTTPIPLYSILPNLCENGNDLLLRMLTFNSDMRISASQALNHVFLREERLNT